MRLGWGCGGQCAAGTLPSSCLCTHFAEDGSFRPSWLVKEWGVGGRRRGSHVVLLLQPAIGHQPIAPGSNGLRTMTAAEAKQTLRSKSTHTHQ